MDDLDDFVVAVRTYDRADIFLKYSYRVIFENNLTDRLYIFVANEQEHQKYKQALQDKPYKKIVTAVVGINAVQNFMCDYFPPNKRILFMDDDIPKFYFFDASHNLISRATNLKDVCDDGFKTIDKYNLGLFSFWQTTNKLYLQKMPWKAFLPRMQMPMYGCRNNKELIADLDSGGCEDYPRAARYWDVYGGVLFYFWCGFPNNCNTVKGGLQSQDERQIEKTKQRSLLVLENHPYLRKYCEPDIFWQQRFNKWSMKWLSIRKRKALVKEKFPEVKFLKWSKWFQEDPDTS